MIAINATASMFPKIQTGVHVWRNFSHISVAELKFRITMNCVLLIPSKFGGLGFLDSKLISGIVVSITDISWSDVASLEAVSQRIAWAVDQRFFGFSLIPNAHSIPIEHRDD